MARKAFFEATEAEIGESNTYQRDVLAGFLDGVTFAIIDHDWKRVYPLLEMVTLLGHKINDCHTIVFNNDKKVTSTILGFTAGSCKTNVEAMEFMTYLLRLGANINESSDCVLTTLAFAAKYSNSNSSIEAVKFLVDHGADVNQPNVRGETALMMASWNSNSSSSLSTVKYLVEQGANVNAQNIDGQTALMFASQFSKDKSSVETVKYLLSCGANVALRDVKGQSTLNLLIGRSLKHSSLEAAEYLIEAGADVNAKCNQGHTTLDIAICCVGKIGSLEGVRFMVDVGAFLTLNKYGIQDAEAKSFLKTYPVRHLKAITNRLRNEMVLIELNQTTTNNVNCNIEHKMQWEGHEDCNHDVMDLTKLPYHMIPESLPMVLEYFQSDTQGWFSYDVDDLERARLNLLQTCNALSRVIERSNVGIRMKQELAEKDTKNLLKRQRGED